MPCYCLSQKTLGKLNSTFHVFVAYFGYSAATWITSGYMFYLLTYLVFVTTNSLVWRVCFNVPRYVWDSKFGITLRCSRTVCQNRSVTVYIFIILYFYWWLWHLNPVNLMPEALTIILKNFQFYLFLFTVFQFPVKTWHLAKVKVKILIEDILF